MLFDNSVKPKNKKNNKKCNAYNSRKKYITIRDNEYFKDQKIFCEDLFKNYGNLADINFKEKFPDNLQQLFWEMYLGNVLINYLHDNKHSENKKLVNSANNGPDFEIYPNQIMNISKKLWIEAVCPRIGEYDYLNINRNKIPKVTISNEILLRYTQALSSKINGTKSTNGYSDYLKQEIVSDDDYYVIALNAALIDNKPIGSDYFHRIFEALLPIKNQIISYNIYSNKVKEIKNGSCEYIPKHRFNSFEKISTNYFNDKKYKGISGLLLSYSTCGYYKYNLGSDFVFIHNPLVANKLPKSWLKKGIEINFSKS